MKGLRKKSIDMLCGFGKFGLGKSITLGMYDFEVPAKLMSGGSQDDNSDAFIVKCEKEDYDVLYLPSSFQIAKIEKGSDVEKMQIPECELMEKEERKLRLGEGKVGITFMSARTCNLRCKYCYAGEGEYGNVSDKPKILSADMYMKAVKMVLREYSEGIKSISFFGGEPLIGFK